MTTADNKKTVTAPFTEGTTVVDAPKPNAADAPKPNAAEAIIYQLAHTKENWSLLCHGKTDDEILTEVKDAGFKLGKASLKAMLAGEKTTSGDFQMLTLDPKEAKAAAKKAAQEAAAAAKAALAEQNKPADAPKPEENKPATAPVNKTKATGGNKELTPEQIKLAQDTEKAIPTKETAPPVEKPPRVLNDVSHLLPAPGTYTPLLRDSTMAKMFEMLVRPEGATKAEMMTAFGWSAGGFAGIIHWEPKKKGYSLGSTKVDNVLHYHLAYNANDPQRPNGHLQRVTAAELTYREKKPAPVVKSAEEKAAEKATKDAAKAAAKLEADNKKAAEKAAAAAAKPAPEPETPKVKVTKEQLGDVPAAGGGNVTKRVSKRKAASAA